MNSPDLAGLESLPWHVLDSFHEGCQVIGFDGTYLYLNEAAAYQGRRSKVELLGRSMVEMYPGIERTEMYQLLRRCMEHRVTEQMENVFTYPDGSVAWFELRFVPVPEGVFILSLDISSRRNAEAEQRRMEEQLQQAQRLETIGRLAGGVAHDFNNLLSVIVGHAELGVDALAEDHPARRDLLEVLEAAQRAAGLTQQLLAFSRRQVLNPESLELADVVAGMESMLRRLLREDIQLIVQRRTPGRVKADRRQLEQVLMNLLVNSRDAMPQGGKLIISTDVVDLDDSYAGQRVALNPGEYVMLAVTDTGLGMDEAVRAHIFEPFFTTKPPGAGTGLGLATVYGIVKQSGGHIYVYSEPGKGTSFKIYLPLDRSGGATAPAVVLPAPSPARGETVLLVEDEPAVREVTSRILARAGYRVVAVGDGAEALALPELVSAPPVLLITDVVMPGLNGRELATRLSELLPDLRVLFMSGYTDDAIVHHGVLDPGIHFISKPFSAVGLARKVREVLDA